MPTCFLLSFLLFENFFNNLSAFTPILLDPSSKDLKRFRRNIRDLKQSCSLVIKNRAKIWAS